MTGLAFNPLADGFAVNANALFKEMRAHCPIHVREYSKFRCLSFFKMVDVKTVMSDHQTWSSDIPEFRELILGDAAILIQDDPPAHTK
jgi:hypothetical protein